MIRLTPGQTGVPANSFRGESPEPARDRVHRRRHVVGAIVTAWLAFLFVQGCADDYRPPAKMKQVNAMQYEKDALSVSFVLADSWGRMVKAKGRALIDVGQELGADDSGALTTVYHAVRDVEEDDFTTAETLGGSRLECDLGPVSYTDMDRWQELQGGTTPRMDTSKPGKVRVRFVTTESDTLEGEYPFQALWARPGDQE